MDDSRLARYRAAMRQRDRQLVLNHTVPRVTQMLDNYVKARRGELTPVVRVLWWRVFFATAAVVGGLKILSDTVGSETVAQGVGGLAVAGSFAFVAVLMKRKVFDK